jgi:hypothetical protein
MRGFNVKKEVTAEHDIVELELKEPDIISQDDKVPSRGI